MTYIEKPLIEPATWYPILKRMCHKAAYSWDIEDLLQDCATYILKNPPPIAITPQWLFVLARHRYSAVKSKEQRRYDLVPTIRLDVFGPEGPPTTTPETQENEIYLKEIIQIIQQELGLQAEEFLGLCQTETPGKGSPKGFIPLSTTERTRLFRWRKKVKLATEEETAW